MPDTPRERVLKSLRHHAPDRIPHQVTLTRPARLALEERLGPVDLDRALGNHLAIYSTRRMSPWEEVRPGFFRDEFGVTWNRTVDTDIGVVEEPVLKGPSLDGYGFPDPLDPRRYEQLPSFVDGAANRFRLVTHGFSMFERAWTLRGMGELLTDMLDAPGFVDGLLDALLEFDLGVVRELCRHDIDGILFGDDWGSQRGLIMGPALWRRFIRPRMEVLFMAVRRAGRFVFLHSCGKVQELFPDLIDMGLDVFNPFQPEVMDPFEMKRAWGNRLSFYGGMSVQKVLPHGTPAEVREFAKRLVGEVGRGGGYIVAPSHDVPGDVPVDNLLAFVETVRGE